MLQYRGRFVATLGQGGPSSRRRCRSSLSCDPHWHVAPRERPVSKLSVLVVSPTVGHARRREPTRVVKIGTHTRKRQSARNGNGRQVVGRCPIAELAVRVPTPAVGGAVEGDA